MGVMFLATSETLSQYIHMMLEAVDTIELHVLGCCLIALMAGSRTVTCVYTHSRAHKVKEKSLQTGHVKHHVDIMQLCITGATEIMS